MPHLPVLASWHPAEHETCLLVNKQWHQLHVVSIVSLFMPFNFAVLCSLQNVTNKGHTNNKGFTVFTKLLQKKYWTTFHVQYCQQYWFFFYKALLVPLNIFIHVNNPITGTIISDLHKLESDVSYICKGSQVLQFWMEGSESLPFLWIMTTNTAQTWQYSSSPLVFHLNHWV